MLRLIIILFLFMNFSFAQQNNPKEEFEKIHSSLLTNLPESFSGELKSQNIQKNLNNIPKDSYINKNARVYVEVTYSKKNGINFVVKNVDELYRDLYKNLPKQIFAFDLLLSRTEPKLIEKYEVATELDTETTLILSLRIKNSENKISIYIDKKVNKILRIDYAMGKNFMTSTIVLYKDIKGYSIPYKFITKNLTSKENTMPEIYEIDNIQIK
ncbi:MAG: hypothetical protein N2258_08850 [Brevinematales bacterium]|nr:hypothetical protein [Brevinematales bacterium]